MNTFKRLVTALAGAGMSLMLGMLFTTTVKGNAWEARNSVEVPTYADSLFTSGDCWLNDGKKHPMPTEVIVTWADGDSELLTDSVSVGMAIEQVLGGPKHFKEVNGFCVV